MLRNSKFKKRRNIILDTIIILLIIAIAVVLWKKTPPDSTINSTNNSASTTIGLVSQDDLNENGSAIISDNGNGTSLVTISISGEPTSANEPATIYTGFCDLIGGKAYPLNDVINGYSTTTIEASVPEMLNQELPLTLNIEESKDISTSTACGDIGTPN